jgi:hypothetical protein
MKNILTFLTFVILMNTSLNADSSTKNIKSFLEIDECASFATSLCLQYASPELSYWTIWFKVYGACSNGDESIWN